MNSDIEPYGITAIQEAFMRVEPSERTTGRLFNMVGDQLWPEIMDIPINRYGDIRDFYKPILAKIGKDNLIRFLRRRFGLKT